MVSTLSSHLIWPDWIGQVVGTVGAIAATLAHLET